MARTAPVRRRCCLMHVLADACGRQSRKSSQFPGFRKVAAGLAQNAWLYPRAWWLGCFLPSWTLRSLAPDRSFHFGPQAEARGVLDLGKPGLGQLYPDSLPAAHTCRPDGRAVGPHTCGFCAPLSPWAKASCGNPSPPSRAPARSLACSLGRWL